MAKEQYIAMSRGRCPGLWVSQGVQGGLESKIGIYVGF